MLDRIVLIATLTKAILLGAVAGVWQSRPIRLTAFVSLFVVLTLTSCPHMAEP